ncbi:MAG: tRNA (N6-isopentenyl adenosine(37)-C2)-methylthiotransferase MiaB [Clostridiales bacterium]|nr:tRNA (N6-isopentenyl adenosine(37)-C2)-methylthiotransferase MiaB [Clostridiales bacterium]
MEYIQKVASILSNKKYNIQTMGCQLNENDSEKLSGMAEKMGYKYTDNIEEADLVIFNTCCIRENAENKLFGNVGELKKIKKERDMIIAVGGCMSQQKHIVEKLRQSYPYVDIIFGTHTLHKLPQDIYEVLEKRKKVTDVLDIDGEIYEGLPIKRNSNNSANVTIMYGCNNFCSYCIVPYVRGRERSRKFEDILNEVKDLAKEGYKEITLLGQNVNSYGNDLNDEKSTFANLLYELNKIDGIEIIKFISPHPKDFKDEVIKAIKECEKVHRVIHLPLQSGSDNILKAMNRHYTKQAFIELAEKIRKEIPNVAFTTDIIVGFPGETDEDFQDTLDVVERVEFEQVFMFIYSRRKGTKADTMENQVDEKIKGERLEILKQKVTEIIDKKNKEYVGTIQKILVEGVSKNNENMLTGRTNTNKVINFEGDKELIGKIIDIKIISDHLWYLKGEIM